MKRLDTLDLIERGWKETDPGWWRWENTQQEYPKFMALAIERHQWHRLLCTPECAHA